MDDPVTYISSDMLQKKDVSELLNERISFPQWNPGERVLDIGCGPGDVTANLLFPLLPEDATLVGCDISEEMINYCNRFIKNDRMSFVLQDIQHKEISSNLQLESFSKIFSFHCFHWIIDHRQSIQNMHSLLKPGGEILLLTVPPDHPVILTINELRDSDKWINFFKDRQWFFVYDNPLSLFHDILQEIGFQNINCYFQKKSVCYPSLECFLDLFKAVNPYLKSIPEELKSEYMKDFIDIINRERFIKYDEVTNEVILDYDAMVVVAKKPKNDILSWNC